MKEEKVRIRVRLTEEEKEKLEHDSALCGLTQSEYVRQLCRGIHPKPKPPDVFWRLMDVLYKAHSDLKGCAKYEPSALKLCARSNGWYWTYRRRFNGNDISLAHQRPLEGPH